VKLKACRKCKTLTFDDTCPKCGSKELTPNWRGIIIILNPKESKAAKLLNIDDEGVYALQVR